MRGHLNQRVLQRGAGILGDTFTGQEGEKTKCVVAIGKEWEEGTFENTVPDDAFVCRHCETMVPCIRGKTFSAPIALPSLDDQKSLSETR